MNNESIEVEVISDETPTQTTVLNELALIQHHSELPMESTTRITQTFTPYLAKISDFSKKLQPLLDKMETGAEPDKDDVKLAELIRKAIKANRVEATHKKKDVKENILKEGRFIDNVFKTIESGCDLLESKAKHIEDFHAIKAKNRLDTLEAERRELLRECYADLNHQFVNVREMSVEAWEQYKESLDATLKARKEESERKAKEEEDARIEKEKADREAEEERIRLKAENERIAAENARIQKEAEDARLKAEQEKAKLQAEADAKAKKAADEAEAKAKIEREKAEKEKARLQAEADKAKEESEKNAKKLAEEIAKANAKAKEEADKEAAKKKAEADAIAAAKKADDKTKLITFVAQLEAIQYPEMKDEVNRNHIDLAKQKIEQITNHFKKVAQ